MIYDKLKNIGKYLGCSHNMDIAIQYILTHNLYDLPIGKTVLDGDLVSVNVMNAQSAPADQKQYEIHKKYMDIQIDLAGMEMIQIGDSSSMRIGNYDPSTDFGNVECPALVSCMMGEGNFLICLPGEPHMPGIAAGENRDLKKCVFKVHC